MRMSYISLLVLACTLLGLQPTNCGPVAGAGSLSAASARAGAAGAVAHGIGLLPGAAAAAGAAMGAMGGRGPRGTSQQPKINGGNGNKSAGPSHNKKKGSKKTNHRARAAGHGHRMHLGRSGAASTASLRLKSRRGLV